MLLCINYADESSERKFRPWQQLQTQTAYLFGADEVIEYSPQDIPQWFYQKNKFILDKKTPKDSPKSFREGNEFKLFSKIVIGHGLWKAFIIRDALSKANDGDYVFYLDSGAFFMSDIQFYIDSMENAKTCVMPFIQGFLEKYYTKRDAFILMDCDNEEIANTPQRDSSRLLLKKCPESVALIDEFLVYCQDPRIITDMPNQLGKDNYEGFKSIRNDQSVWSLLTKKRGYKAFERSLKMICHHRMNFRGLMECSIQNLGLVPAILSTVARVKNKERIPKRFQYGLPEAIYDSLAYCVSQYIKQYGSKNFPTKSNPLPKEILASYRELNLPETPSLNEALSKMPTSLNRA